VDAIVTLYGKKPQPQLRVYDFVGKEIVLKRVVAKSELKPPFVYDWLFSECVEFFASVEKHPKNWLTSQPVKTLALLPTHTNCRSSSMKNPKLATKTSI